jgi:hypothetical protein
MYGRSSVCCDDELDLRLLRASSDAAAQNVVLEVDTGFLLNSVTKLSIRRWSSSPPRNVAVGRQH